MGVRAAALLTWNYHDAWIPPHAAALLFTLPGAMPWARTGAHGACVPRANPRVAADDGWKHKRLISGLCMDTKKSSC